MKTDYRCKYLMYVYLIKRIGQSESNNQIINQ